MANPLISDEIDFGTEDNVYEPTPVSSLSATDFGATLKVNGQPLDLTNADFVILLLTNPDGGLLHVNMTIVDAPGGIVKATVGFDVIKKATRQEFEDWTRIWQYKVGDEGSKSLPFTFQVY